MIFLQNISYLQATSSDTSVAEHQNESFDYACKQINNELVEITRRENNSVLRDKGFDGLASCSFADMTKNIKGVYIKGVLL